MEDPIYRNSTPSVPPPPSPPRSESPDSYYFLVPYYYWERDLIRPMIPYSVGSIVHENISLIGKDIYDLDYSYSSFFDTQHNYHNYRQNLRIVDGSIEN